jgi:hypothetical protein
METKAEQDFFQRWRWKVVTLVVVLSGVEALLLGVWKGGRVHWPVLLLVAQSVIPNFIAALIALLAVYVFVRDNDRANYVRAMRSVRGAVHELLRAGRIKPDDVQTLMRSFVPAVSSLYFKSDEPTVPSTDLNLNYTKETCFACEQPSPVVRGRCMQCRDILPSWREDEQPSGR